MARPRTFIIVVAKTDPNERAKGISLMLLETEGAEGFQRGKKLDKIGLDASDTSELFFDDVFVPAENVLGGEEGKGFYQLMGELPQERLIIAMGAMTGIEKRAGDDPGLRQEPQGFWPDNLGFSEHAIRHGGPQGPRDRSEDFRQ